MKKIFALALALLLPLSTLTPGALAVEHAAPPVQPEENPLPDVWTEVSTAEELFAAGGSAPLVRLTEDLTVTAADAQFFPFWTPTTLDMNGHCIRVAQGGCFSFGGGAYPLILIGDGGETGLLQVEAGGELQIENIDASQVAGPLARQAEGGWLVTQTVTAAPEQMIYAQAPVLRENSASFAVLPQGLAQEELLEQLPELSVSINFQGQSEPVTLPADQLSWDLETQWPGIEAGHRTLLHAQPVGPLSGVDWPESELSPVLFDALTCELAILVDGAAIGNIAVRNYVCGSSYALSIFLPDQVQPDGHPLSSERSPAFLELSLDNGATWFSASVGEDMDTDLLFIRLSARQEDAPGDFQASLDVLQETGPLLIRAGADYRGDGYRYRLYTDTLSLSSAGVPTQSDIGGSRGGTLDILPARPDPEPPAQLEAEPPLQLKPEPEPPTQPEPEPEPPTQPEPEPELPAQPEPELPARPEPEPELPTQPEPEPEPPTQPEPEPELPTQPEPEPELPTQPEPEPEPPTQPEPEPVPLVQQNPDPVLSIQPAPESTAQPEPPQDSVLPAVVQQPQAQVPEPEPSSTPATPEPLSPVQPANVQPPAQPKNQPVDTEPEGLSPAVQIAAGAAVTCVLVAAAAAKPAAPLNWLRRLLHRP